MEPFTAAGPRKAIERLRSGRTSEDRVAAALALAEVDSPESIAALAGALGDPSQEVRAVSVLVLTDLRDPASIAVLAGVVATWTDPSLRACRRAALRALAAFRSEAAALELARALVTGPPEAPLGLDERSALLAVVYAETMGMAATGVVRELVALLGHDDEGRADRAALLLELFPSESCGPLTRALRSARSSGARRRAAQALRVCRNDDVVSALVAALSDRAPAVRAAAARSLGDMRAPTAVSGLEIAARDPNDGVREAARSALAEVDVAAPAGMSARVGR
jgi:HEAT repeat protein